MSETLTRDDLYNLIFGKLPDWMQPVQRQQAALDVLDELEPIIGHRGIGDNQPPEPIEGETEEERLKRIDPTNLLIVPVEQIPTLLELQYPRLPARAEELLGDALQWVADHTDAKGGFVPIADDVELDELSVVMGQLHGFFKDHGEVDSVRREVKLAPWEAISKIDAWFNNLRARLAEIHGQGDKAPPSTMQGAQNLYLHEKSRRLQAELDRQIAEAAAEARRKADEARRIADEETARAQALQGAGLDAQTAADVAATTTDRAAEEADAAFATSALIGQAASAPEYSRAKTMGALRTTSLGGKWDFDEGQVDVDALCKAVVAGEAPSTFVTANARAIREAITRKISPLRKCPGLVIAQTFAARRSGR